MKSGMVPRGDSALAQAVAAARRQGVDPAVLARVQARALSAAASVPPPALPAGSGSWSRARWTYLGGGMLLLAAVLQLSRPANVPVPSAIAAAAAPPALAAPSVPALLSAPAPVSAPPIELPAAAPADASSPRRRSAHPAPSAAAPVIAEPQALDAPGELALLRRALAVLPSRPTLALELAEQHEAEHPHGVFAQEREAIAIDAYLALQRTAAAEARVRRFLAAYPRSPHAPRMRALLGEQEEAPAPTHRQAPTPRQKENR